MKEGRKAHDATPSPLSYHFSTTTDGLQPSSVSRIYIGELQVRRHACVQACMGTRRRA